LYLPGGGKEYTHRMLSSMAPIFGRPHLVAGSKHYSGVTPSTTPATRATSIGGGLSAIFALAFLFISSDFAQAQSKPPVLQPGNAPKTVVYRHLFKHMEYLEEQAKAMERAGADARPLRDHYKAAAKLSDSEDSLLKGIAFSTNAAVDAQDRKAKAIVDAVRAKHPDGRLAPGEKVPDPPKELAQLQAVRSQLLDNAIAQVRSAFGEKRFQDFEAFVETKVSPKVAWTPVLITPPQP
jgi:hypothetical protein